MPKIYDKSTIGGRLLFLIETLKKKGIVDKEGKMNSSVFAEEIGINRSQFSRVTQNDLNITLSQIMQISSIYGVRTGWIIEGEEPIFKKKSGALDGPDDLLSQVKTQIDNLLPSLHKLSDSIPLNPEEENSDQGEPYQGFSVNKSQSTDKL